MSKFKEGDKVVFILNDRPNYHDFFKVGNVYTVRELYDFGIYVSEINGEHAREYQLEFEDVYNSPLYQALK